MSESRAAYRYALALIGVAEELHQIDAISADCAMLAKALADSRDLRLFLKSPVVNKHKKRIVLDELLKGKVTDTTYHFIGLITSKERETILPEIITAFNALLDKHRGVLRATVTTAVALTPGQREELGARLHDVTCKTVVFSEVIDPGLIGGFTVRFDDTVWDSSTRRQLELLREQFAAATP